MTAQKQPVIKEYNLVQILEVSPKKVVKCLAKGLGQKVKKGELIASVKKPLKKKDFLAPIEGILSSLTEKGILRIEVPVKKKIKTKPLSVPEGFDEIKGSWGKGERAIGDLFCLEGEATIFNLKGKHEGQILALEGKLSRGLWYKSESLGIKGIICGGLPNKGFSQEIEKEVLVVNGEKMSVTFPLVVFGEKDQIPAEVWRVLKEKQGQKVIIEGDNCRLLIPK